MYVQRIPRSDREKRTWRLPLWIVFCRTGGLNIELSENKKCSFDGFVFKPNGVDPLDPCRYIQIEEHRNVTVKVLRCKNCGHIELEWCRQDDTEDLLGDDMEV